jgi:hypothetical protein
MTITKLVRPIMLTMALAALGACGGYDYDYYPYNYGWSYAPYGTVTVVRRPITVVDGWTRRTWRYRPYRGYRIYRHNSPSITYKATKGDDVLEVILTPQDKQETKVEVRSLKGDQEGDREQAKVLMGRILKDYRDGNKH